MKQALILHGTDFGKDGNQNKANWYPWLKKELGKLGYKVWLPELPEAWHPDLRRYWDFLSGFDFNHESILVGHSSGGSAVFGLLHKLPKDKKVKLAVSIAGFYKDEGWGCKGLFKEEYDWKKIKNQAEKIYVIASGNDPYISMDQTNYIAKKLEVKPTIFPNSKHFSVSTDSKFTKFPELFEIIKQNV